MTAIAQEFACRGCDKVMVDHPKQLCAKCVVTMKDKGKAEREAARVEARRLKQDAKAKVKEEAAKIRTKKKIAKETAKAESCGIRLKERIERKASKQRLEDSAAARKIKSYIAYLEEQLEDARKRLERLYGTSSAAQVEQPGVLDGRADGAEPRVSGL